MLDPAPMTRLPRHRGEGAGSDALGNPADSPEVFAVAALARARRPSDRGITLDEVKRQFVEQVKLRADDDKYIDKNEEREILQIAL